MRIRTAALVLLLLYPWIVGFGSADPEGHPWKLTVGLGTGAYHQIERDCYAVETYQGPDSGVGYRDSATIDRVGRFSEAALDISHDQGFFEYGARVGMFHTRDNRYLFDTDRFLTSTLLLYSHPRQFTFDPVTMWYANPYLSIHGSRRSFSGHFNFGLLFGIAPAEHASTVFPTVGAGLQIDSVFFIEGSFFEGVPLISDGGPIRGMLGTCIPQLNGTMLWAGIGLGSPYHDGVAFVKGDVPIGEKFRVAVTVAGLASSEWSLASSLKMTF
jgi:hypothetical protein